MKLNKSSKVWNSANSFSKWRFPSRCHHISQNRAFSLTWQASMLIYWNKRKFLHKKRIQLPQDCLGTPTWPLFHCFGTPIWPPWRHVKTLYKPYGIMWQPRVFIHCCKIWPAVKNLVNQLTFLSSRFPFCWPCHEQTLEGVYWWVTSALWLEKMSKHRGGLGRACLWRYPSKAGIQFCRWRKYKRYIGKKFNLWWKSFENEFIKMWTNTVETNYFKK